MYCLMFSDSKIRMRRREQPIKQPCMVWRKVVHERAGWLHEDEETRTRKTVKQERNINSMRCIAWKSHLTHFNSYSRSVTQSKMDLAPVSIINGPSKKRRSYTVQVCLVHIH